ncbi:putative FAD NAD -binding protein [Rosellinia necatrix]|uniref:Putative FAD NAD-binding protein n=1 Tax=Rosellinia necatrix TaxID=77044 RepID=A0A1W2TE17_ROSNE|nr:putative FAD NAD -binding protein [Rosellinia necatrix]
MPRLRILVSGGGIAGNALAFWLSKIGHDITVVERFSNLRDTGLQLDLRGHGIEVMKRMGLQEAFRAQVSPEKGVQLVDKKGRRRAYFPSTAPGEGVQNFTTEFEIMRGNMCRIFHDGAVRNGARFVFGTSIESLEDKGGSVMIRFADSKTDSFDLVVGADGLNSRTRKMMLGPGADDGLRPLDGVVAGYFTMPRPMREGEEYLATFFIAPGNKGLMIRRSDPDFWQVYVGGKTGAFKDVPRGDVAAEKATMTEMMRGAGWVTDEVLAAMNTDNDFYLERMALVKLDRWFRGRVALVGDAAWCPTANTGMGTTCSVVGAYILAGEIGRHCGRGTAGHARGPDAGADIARALAAYDQKFRPFIDQVQKGVAEESGGFGVLYSFLSTTVGISLVHVLAAFASFFKVNIGAIMLKEQVKDWDLPDYEELLREA